MKQEFYKLGLESGVNSSRDQVYVTLSGLEENLDKGVELFEYLLANTKPGSGCIQKICRQHYYKKRADAKLDKDNILFQGLISYGAYGAKNPFNDILSNEALQQVKGADLVALIKSLHDYKHIDILLMVRMTSLCQGHKLIGQITPVLCHT